MVNMLPFIFVLIIWLITFYQGISTAVVVWNISEIFTHCFLVIPGAFYLIFQKRKELYQEPFEPNFWLLIPLLTLLLLQTFGVVGDIRLLMHIATFTSLPLVIWLMIGNNAAKKIAFPLFFILFSIPFGESLIPFLQEFTTDLAVPLLEMTGVPIFRNGLYLDIPEGRFLVAEACSGISFLIASVVFGNVYAYLSYKSIAKRFAFVLISILVPILANAVRVYGIILTAHLTDMEYAAGADHLIYGGVFYTFILFLLILIGEKFRDKNVHLSPFDNTGESADVKVKHFFKASACVLVLFVAQFYWLSSIESDQQNMIVHEKNLDFSAFPFAVDIRQLNDWKPSYETATNIEQGFIQQQRTVQNIIENNIEFFIATYVGGKGELISSLNRLYGFKRWVLLEKEVISVGDDGFNLILTKLVSPDGKYRYIAHWYQLDDIRFTSKIKTKLYQTFNLLLGKQQIGRLVAFSIQTSTIRQGAKNELVMFLQKNKVVLDKVF